jgi:hypothetical protein
VLCMRLNRVPLQSSALDNAKCDKADPQKQPLLLDFRDVVDEMLANQQPFSKPRSAPSGVAITSQQAHYVFWRQSLR